MKLAYSVLAVVLLFAAAFIFLNAGQKTPINADSMNITQDNDEVLLRVVFSGNSIPAEVNGRLSLVTSEGEFIYDREFMARQADFRNVNGNVVLERHLKLATGKKFDYAELILYLQNQTFHAEQGRKPDVLDMVIEAIQHESQYAVSISLLQNGKMVSSAGALSLQVIDKERLLYNSTIYISENDFRDNRFLVLIPYGQVPKSFYGTGNLLVSFQGKEKRLDIPLRQLSEAEKKAEEEREFSKHLAYFNNYTDYAGFRFNITRAGYYFAYLPERTAFVRFDAKLKNLQNRPQYLIRSDFYIKDNDRNFYPVHSRLSSPFGPLLKSQEEVTASFYFALVANKRSYSFYYGDKKLVSLGGN